MIADRNANLIYRDNTIDTISKAQIKISEINGEKTLSAPPLTVNANGATYRNLLFIESKLLGKYDDKSAWEKSSTIDIYDLKKGNYLFSFYIPAYKNKKLSKIMVMDEYIYILVDTQLIMYKTQGLLQQKLKE